MELNEIVVEGLRGFPQMTRVPLGPQLTMVHPADERGSVLRAALLDLLYPQGTELTLQELIDPSAAMSRIGLLLVARDGTPFRLLKDVRGGKITLLRQGPAGMEPVSSTAAEIAQVVTAQIGFPQQDLLREIFITAREDMPSQRPDALEISGANLAAPPAAGPTGGQEASGKNKAWNKPLPPGFAELEAQRPDFGHLSDDEKRKKLADLKEQLAHLAGVKELEFELDGLQKKGFALDEKLRPLDHLKRQLSDAEKTVERFSRAAQLPTDLPEQKAHHLTQKVAFDAQVHEIDEKRIKIEERLRAELKKAESAQGFAKVALQDPLVLYGTAGGALALVLGVVGLVAFEPLRYVALLDIAGFGAALVGAFRFISEAENAALLRGQLQRLELEKARLADKFDLEASHFRALLKRHQLTLEDIESIEEEVRAYREALHAREAAKHALDEALGGADLGALLAEREALSGEVKKLEEKLYAAGGYGGNRADLEAQIQDLEDSLAGRARREPVSEVAPEPSGPMAAAPGPGLSSPGMSPLGMSSPGISAAGIPAAGMGETARAVQRMVSLASDLLVSDLDTTCNALAPRAAQYLSGMSDRRYGQMIFGPKGEVSVVDAASGRAIPFGMLTPGDRDIAYLSLKMTIVELTTKRARLPVILDRAFETFPEPKHPLLVRMVQFLAQSTQVLVLTRKPTIAAAGGQLVALPPPS